MGPWGLIYNYMNEEHCEGARECLRSSGKFRISIGIAEVPKVRLLIIVMRPQVKAWDSKGGGAHGIPWGALGLCPPPPQVPRLGGDPRLPRDRPQNFPPQSFFVFLKNFRTDFFFF